jgi:ABC-2 type transport system ATP-binding protein
MNDKAIILEAVSKSYVNHLGLHPTDLSINTGEIFGLIGPDGAGKTTLLRLMATLIKPRSGYITILGNDAERDYRNIRVRIGYMPGRFSLYQDLSVDENIRFYSSVFGISFAAALEQVAPIYKHLSAFKHRRAGALSGGMKQKLALCCALVHKPEILILDEPTTGVDAVSRTEFWDLLSSLNKGGMTIVVSTPYMDEAAQCNRIALIQEGRILQIGSPREIITSEQIPIIAIKTSQKYKTLQLLRKYLYTDQVYVFGEALHYTDQRTTPDVSAIETWLKDQGISDCELSSIEPGIEDVFIRRMMEDTHGE